MDKITERIQRESGVPDLASILDQRLTPSDLQSLLLEVYGRRARRLTPPDVLRTYRANRFVRPSEVSPLSLLEWERIAFGELPEGFVAVTLSPVCPIGTSSVIGDLTQDWAVTTVRNTEVVSDSTNVLALESALRRQELLSKNPKSSAPVHLAASHRLLRAQRYNGPGLVPHFSAFAMCSAGRDRGNSGFEVDALYLHIRFYLTALRAYLGPEIPLHLTVTDFARGTTHEPPERQLLSALRHQPLENMSYEVDEQRTQGREYYSGLCFHIFATTNTSEQIQLVDGGSVPWTQRLISNAKERLVISGIGSDRLCGKFEPRRDA